MTEKIKFETAPVFEVNRHYLKNKKYKILCNQGGTRSGKTYNIIILLILIAITTPKLAISIVSESVPHLKRGAIRDFMEIMNGKELYKASQHNKTDQIYTFENGAYIEFFSADNNNKLRGSSRDILFVNEADLLSYDSFKQLLLRTRQKVIIDYNPAYEFHWIYDHIVNRDDCMFIKSTYLDNYEFLPKSMIKEIERLKIEDENYWRIYGLGERGIAQETIYNNFEIVDSLPEKIERQIYGLDFGFNNPTSLTDIPVSDDKIYIDELLYQTKLTNTQLIDKMKTFNINKNDVIYGDNAEPARIEEISKAGFNIKPANKSVKDGIDYCKRKKLHITKRSVNIIKEIRQYKYKVDKNGNVLDEPVKFMDHAMDGIRYALYTDFLSRSKGTPGIRILGR